MVVLSPVVLAHAAAGASAAAANQVTLQPTGSPGANPILAAVVPNPYGCYGKSDRPHISGHYPDRVTAQGKTACTVWQPYEFVESYLYRKDCFFFVCWWTQVGHDWSSKQSWGAVYAHPNYTCNGTSSHTYRIESYHEVHGSNGRIYTGNTASEYDVPCG
ncbi:MAG: hypothetical protein M3077_15020 [Candidatus Dormibacteraeota bacterium]|nr:hypothetical protein [Candidatus Dormibacteraeota bacterium]